MTKHSLLLAATSCFIALHLQHACPLPHQSDRIEPHPASGCSRDDGWLATAEAPPSRYLLNSRYACRGVIVISSAAARAVNLSPSSCAKTSRQFSSRLLITTMPIEMTSSELSKWSGN